MTLVSRWSSSLVLAAALLSPLILTGCTGHGYYRVYDPYDHQYRRWDGNENVYYHQWTTENHRDDRDFRKLDHDDQNRYWQWRHDHGHDHDHDNDRH